MLGIELGKRKRQPLNSMKCETYDSLKNKISSLYDTLGKFTEGRQNLYLTLYNQMTLYKESGLYYQPNKNFISKCHAKKKTIRPIFKCNYCHKLCNLEHLCFYEICDLRWSKGYDSRHLKPTST